MGFYLNELKNYSKNVQNGIESIIWCIELRKFYEVSYVDGKYIIQIIPERYDVIGFYTDSKRRRRPITRSRRRIRNVEPPVTKVVSPLPSKKSRRIVKKISYSRKRPSRVIGDWWSNEVRRLYEELKRHGSILTPIHVMALVREVRKRRPEWNMDQVYEYLDSKLDASLTYDELKTIIVNELGLTPEESIQRYEKPLSDKEIEELYQDYLKDVEELGVEEDYEPGDISLLIEESGGPGAEDYIDFYGEVM